MDQQNANFEGWALIELYGHGREAGYVTTQHFGSACLFQVDIPEIEARQETLASPKWAEDGSRLLPVGSVIEREAVAGRTRLLGVGSIYAINPATEAAVRAAVAASERRTIKVMSIPEGVQPVLAAPEEDDEFDGAESEDIPEGYPI